MACSKHAARPGFAGPRGNKIITGNYYKIIVITVFPNVENKLPTKTKKLPYPLANFPLPPSYEPKWRKSQKRTNSPPLVKTKNL